MGDDISLRTNTLQERSKEITPKIIHVALLLTMRVVLDLAYMKVVSPYWTYAGYGWEPNPTKIIESYIVTLLLGAMLPHSLRRPSDYLVNLLSMIPIMPSLSLYGLLDKSRAYTYMMTTCFIVIIVVRRLRSKTFKAVRGGLALGCAICVFIVVLSLVERLATGRLQYFSLDLREVYEYRPLLDETTSARVFEYVHTWAQKAAMPALIAWSLHIERRWVLVLLLGIQLLFFGTSAAKAVLFYPFLVMAVFWVSHRRRALHLTVLGLTSVIAICSTVALTFGNLMPVSLFVRRLFFVPARLNYAYYEYFSSAGYVYMSNSVLRGVLSYPFDYRPAHLVSYYLAGHTDTWMNTGFLGTGYMHFGFLGMIVFSIVVGFLMGFVDVISDHRIPLPFAIATVIVPFFTMMVSADLPTALLSHGVALSVILLWLFGVSRPSRSGNEQ